jgi:hypothetical protein
MYGLGGSFGGQPYTSPIGAGANGILTGFQLVRQQQEQDRQNARQDALDAQNAAHLQFMDRNEADQARRADFKQAWDVHDAQRRDIGDQMNEVLARYGGDSHAAQNDPQFQTLQAQIQQWNGVHNALMKSVYSGPLLQGLDDAKATTQKMNAGQFDPTHPANAEELAHWTSVMYRHDPSMLIKRDPTNPQTATQNQFGAPVEGQGIAGAEKGASDQVADAGQAAMRDDGSALTTSMWLDGANDLHQGLSTGDPKKVATGFQALYGPQIEAGRLGYLDKLGGQVTSAVINPDKPFVPTPDGSKAMPVLSMSGQLPDGSTTQQDYAPPTQGGFHHDDNQDLHALDLSKTFDYLGTQGAAHSILQHPLVQNNLADYMKNPSPKVTDWAQAYTAIGAGDGLLVKMERVGNHFVAMSFTKDGRLVSSKEIPGSLPPTTEYEAREEALRNAVANGETNPATGQPWTQADADNARISGIQKPVAGGKADVAEQKLQIALDLAKRRFDKGGTQEDYDNSIASLVGLDPKAAGPNEKFVETSARLAREEALLKTGQWVDPVGGLRTVKPDEAKGIQAGIDAERAALEKAYGPNGKPAPANAGIGPGTVHTVPGTGDPNSQNPEVLDQGWVTRAMAANPTMTREQVEEQGRKLKKFTKKPPTAAQ